MYSAIEYTLHLALSFIYYVNASCLLNMYSSPRISIAAARCVVLCCVYVCVDISLYVTSTFKCGAESLQYSPADTIQYSTNDDILPRSGMTIE